MVSRKEIVRRILAYLNGEVDLNDLVRWSEDALFALSEAPEDHPDETKLMRILGYIGAGDTADFPLTWTVLSTFLEELDTKVRIVEMAA